MYKDSNYLSNSHTIEPEKIESKKITSSLDRELFSECSSLPIKISLNQKVGISENF